MCHRSPLVWGYVAQKSVMVWRSGKYFTLSWIDPKLITVRPVAVSGISRTFDLKCCRFSFSSFTVWNFCVHFSIVAVCLIHVAWYLCVLISCVLSSFFRLPTRTWINIGSLRWRIVRKRMKSLSSRTRSFRRSWKWLRYIQVYSIIIFFNCGLPEYHLNVNCQPAQVFLAWVLNLFVLADMQNHVQCCIPDLMVFCVHFGIVAVCLTYVAWYLCVLISCVLLSFFRLPTRTCMNLGSQR